MFFGPLEDLLILWEQVWLNLSPLSIIVWMSLDIPCQYQLCPLTHKIDLCRDYPHFTPFQTSAIIVHNSSPYPVC